MAHMRLFCVFRIVNEERKEIYLAATALSIIDAIAALRDHRPYPLRGWDFEEIRAVETLEFNLTREEAAAFMDERMARGTRRGYKYLLDFPQREEP